MTDKVRALSDEELRVKVAELDGWKRDKQTGYFLGDTESLPNYLHDLNAVHEIEEKLDGDQVSAYAKLLGRHHPTYCVKVLDGRDPEEDFWYETFTLIHATARQRCEALVLTLSPEEPAQTGDK